MRIEEYREYRSEEILRLYASVGWKAYTDHPDTLCAAFGRSLLILSAREGDELVGILRAVGDAETIVFVQDLLVSPDYQGKGIGTALLKELFERYPRVRQIELITDDSTDTVGFYASLGFRELGEFGCRGFMKG